MKNQNLLTKVLAVVGTILVWFPILAPVVLGIAALFTRGRFLFDFLMPAELFPFALAGSLLLLWASRHAHEERGHPVLCIAAAMSEMAENTRDDLSTNSWRAFMA